MPQRASQQKANVVIVTGFIPCLVKDASSLVQVVHDILPRFRPLMLGPRFFKTWDYSNIFFNVDITVLSSVSSLCTHVISRVCPVIPSDSDATSQEVVTIL